MIKLDGHSQITMLDSSSDAICPASSTGRTRNRHSLQMTSASTAAAKTFAWHGAAARGAQKPLNFRSPSISIHTRLEQNAGRDRIRNNLFLGGQESGILRGALCLYHSNFICQDNFLSSKGTCLKIL